MLFNRIWLCVVIFNVFSQMALSQDWPQWRGPNRDGHAPDFIAPDKWPEQLTKVWSVEIGAGISSPVIGDGKIYLLTREGDLETVSCLDITNGQVSWQQSYDSPFYANATAANPRRYPISQGKGPFATPALSNGQLFTLGVNRVLSSFDARTGKLNWRQHYLKIETPEVKNYICPPCGCQHDKETFTGPGTCPSCNMPLNPPNLETSARRGGGNYYGAAASPIIAGDTGIVHIGNPKQGIVIAFDVGTGHEKWRWDSPIIAYSSPVIAEINGTSQLIVLSRTSVAGLAVDRGELLWSFPVDFNSHTVTPVVYKDLVIFAPYQGPTIAIKIARDGKKWSANEAWKNTNATLWMSSPILDGNKLYGFLFSNKGQFAALKAASGDLMWASEGRQGEFATVVGAKDFLLGFKEDGDLSVMHKNANAFTQLAKYSVAETPIWAHPVVWDKNILVKDEKYLTLWRL